MDRVRSGVGEHPGGGMTRVEAPSAASAAILSYLVEAIRPEVIGAVAGGTGLPAGGVWCPEQRLALFATPVTLPLFDTALVGFTEEHGVDALLVRHGFHPEILDPVRIDVALTDHQVWRNLSLCRLGRRRWIVTPDRRHALALGREGLDVEEDWSPVFGEVGGFECAAADIVRRLRLCRKGETG